jgi:hypothetical protein
MRKFIWEGALGYCPVWVTRAGRPGYIRLLSYLGYPGWKTEVHWTIVLFGLPGLERKGNPRVP